MNQKFRTDAVTQATKTARINHFTEPAETDAYCFNICLDSLSSE
jgi:hypothetical protein